MKEIINNNKSRKKSPEYNKKNVNINKLKEYKKRNNSNSNIYNENIRLPKIPSSSVSKTKKKNSMIENQKLIIQKLSKRMNTYTPDVNINNNYNRKYINTTNS